MRSGCSAYAQNVQQAGCFALAHPVMGNKQVKLATRRRLHDVYACHTLEHTPLHSSQSCHPANAACVLFQHPWLSTTLNAMFRRHFLMLCPAQSNDLWHFVQCRLLCADKTSCPAYCIDLACPIALHNILQQPSILPLAHRCLSGLHGI